MKTTRFEELKKIFGMKGNFSSYDEFAISLSLAEKRAFKRKLKQEQKKDQAEHERYLLEKETDQNCRVIDAMQNRTLGFCFDHNCYDDCRARALWEKSY